MIPGTGPLLVADSMNLDATVDWGEISDPYYYEGAPGDPPDPTADPYVLLRRRLRRHPFRRLITRAGVQSLYDAQYDNPAKPSRTQLLSWSRYSARFRLLGERVVYIPFRRHLSGFEYDIGPWGGITKYSQIMQIKSIPTIGKPYIELMQGRDGIKLIHSPLAINGSGEYKEWFWKWPADKWTTVGLKADFAREGWLELWGNVGAGWTQLVPRYECPMLGATDLFGGLCIGNYVNMAWPDGEPTLFEYEDVVTDFRSVRIHEAL